MATVAYLRVSTDRQDLENQRYGVAEYCQANGLALGDVFTDKKSGKLSWRSRDLARLLDRLQPGDVLITPELSRLSRSLQDVFDFLAEAARRRIIVRIIKGQFTIDGSLQSTVLVTAFGLAAEIERADWRPRSSANSSANAPRKPWHAERARGTSWAGPPARATPRQS